MNQRIEAMRIKSVKCVQALVCSVVFLEYFKCHVMRRIKILSCLVTPLPGGASELSNDARHDGPWCCQY